MTLHDRAKALKLRINHKILLQIGLKVVKHFRDSRKIQTVNGKFQDPPRIRVDLVSKRKKPFHWWVANYPEDFREELDKILTTEASWMIKRKKRPRLHEKPEASSNRKK